MRRERISSCDVVAVLRFIGLRRIDEEGKDFEL